MTAATPSAAVDVLFARRLPKIELHAHLTGSISRSCLHDIWADRKTRDPQLELEDPFVAMPPGKVDYDINTFFPLFSSYIYRLCNTIDSIVYSTKAVLQDFQRDGVVYLELRTTPRRVTEQGISKDDYIKTVVAQLREHNRDKSNSLQAFLIISVDRRNTVAEAEEAVDLAIKYQPDGVVGIDLCGDPAQGDVRIYTATFARAKAAGLKITLHFAETENSASDEELHTLLSWQPDRLGHVVHVNDEIRKAIERQDIGVELCLSCNVLAKMITGSYSDHHFSVWRHSTVPVALCTDDVGVFCSPLSHEYYLVAKHFGLDRHQLKALSEGAIRSIFTGAEQQSRLSKIFSDWIDDTIRA
ncbi:Metallo-dependent hydrolase [Lophiostoma macrostomum CBS 122681]|uniref:Metallo-dependent hydrolase n=1 Tax=Lophiostoma macrostomum CBS 122681 TaxID=1314788 RepID=A0A6A6TL17_9PLEO|nr:Metallo-dependent hydrolase [Lophiostoma macrostomum CBS 122681]